ncbi:MAG: hypothetical protein ACNA8W_08690 [Bradymonadaceae bacterium]
MACVLVGTFVMTTACRTSSIATVLAENTSPAEDVEQRATPADTADVQDTFSGQDAEIDAESQAIDLP